MNERIKELAEQASKDNSDGYPVTLEYTNRFAEKFAELIVKECMDIAWRHTPDTEECEYSWLIHDKIKEHFGV
jgi:Zn-finger protein